MHSVWFKNGNGKKSGLIGKCDIFEMPILEFILKQVTKSLNRKILILKIICIQQTFYISKLGISVFMLILLLNTIKKFEIILT